MKRIELQRTHCFANTRDNQVVIQFNKFTQHLFSVFCDAKKRNQEHFHVIIADPFSKRSVAINRRFWGHLMHLQKHLKSSGIDRELDYIKLKVLIEACEIPDNELPPGAINYPYDIIDGTLYPKSTSGRTNKQMMTACAAILRIGHKFDCHDFPEREEYYYDRA